jgi:hypothetical protein
MAVIGKGLLFGFAVGALLIVLIGSGLLTVDASSVRENPHALAKEWGFPDATARRWDPPLATASGMQMVTTVDRHLGPCIAYRGAGYQGGACFQNGWAVQAEFTPAVHGTLIVGMTIAQAAQVRFGRTRDALTVPVVDVPGRSTEKYFAIVVPQDGLKVAPNDIQALDARGRLLGRQHYNDGHGRFGAFDGLYDKTLDNG